MGDHMAENTDSHDVDKTLAETFNVNHTKEIGTWDGKFLQKTSSFDLMDSLFWEPPEAENPLEDMKNSVTIHDVHDNDYLHEMECCGPSAFGEEHAENCFLERNRCKELNSVKNMKFAAAVNMLLKNEGVEGKKWMDVVASLSWEAALFLKLDTINEEAMDPDGYVKVKCIATGQRNDSKLVKGLVFNKRVAHKHMITSCKSPKLLLIKGALGNSSDKLSSFITMDQEKENFKSLMEFIDIFRPNLVLVEKSVSRDIQESMLGKGITLVYDIKLHRLEKISRCTGAPIYSPNALLSQNLQQCDSFHIEKYVEEHAAPTINGKNPSKTVLIIESCATRLGCTILLKGSTIEELKRVKNAVKAAVVLAYHLIVETSFIVNHKAMLSSIISHVDDPVSSQDHTLSGSNPGDFNSTVGSVSESEMPGVDIPISCDDDEGSFKSLFPKPYNPLIFLGFSFVSMSLMKALTYSSLSNILRFNINRPVNVSDEVTINIEYTPSVETQLEDSTHSLSEETSVVANDPNYKEMENGSVLRPQSILVLMSSRNVIRGSACEHTRFSHIMFYKNFDVPLIKFLRKNLLNERHSCRICGDSPESHMYYYAHHTKQLVFRTKRLAKELPGKLEGKTWMWSLCVNCTQKEEIPKCTNRILVSSLGGNISFGRFLELCFTGFFSGMNTCCGHSLESDFYLYFGEGSMAALLKYSPVITYDVFLPPKKLIVCQQIDFSMLKSELQAVHSKGMRLLSAVGDSLKKLSLQIGGNEFTRAENMLKKETSELELRANTDPLSTSESAYFPLILNRLNWDVSVLAYVWNQRLRLLQDGNYDAEHHETKGETLSRRVTSEDELQVNHVDSEEGSSQRCELNDTISGRELFWKPFSEINKILIKDQRAGLPPILYPEQRLEWVHDIVKEEGSRIYVFIGEEKKLMIREYEGEQSSIIGCALAYLNDHSGTKVTQNSPMISSTVMSEVNMHLLESSEVHFGVSKSHPKGRYSVAAIFAKKFCDLRRHCCASELDFIASLSRCKHWDAKGGKSKSLFSKTLDGRFVIKHIKKTEFDSFFKFAPHYFSYLNHCFHNGNQTCLAKIFGIYQIMSRSGGKETRHDVMVMENLLHGQKVTRQYDLKGALYARWSEKSEEVLLDQNFVNDVECSPMYVSSSAKRLLERAVWNDTHFLNSVHVMDYSLLVGVDSDRRVLTCGIIDYLRQYTWDKQLETWVKSSLVVPKNVLPTIISPVDYKKRFRNFISTHFFTVPDHWLPPL